MLGCTNPKAVNYNPAATQDDNSCLYLEKYNGQCYLFQDVDQDEIVDESFTLSFSLDADDWVFFHDYFPDFYFSTRNQLFNLKDRKIYIHHKGAPGVYHSGSPKPFFIDAVFNSQEEMILNAVQWISEVLSSDTQETEFSTFTHITIWNNQQCTGRIPLSDIFHLLEYDRRKTKGVWSFNTFRDMVAETGSKFLLDIFNNFAVDTTKLDMEKPWFNQDLLHDNWFIIRFEFDNASGKKFIFHGADIDVDKSYR